MVLLRFDEGQLKGKLERLSAQQRATFAAACAERLFASYRRFANLTERSPLLLRHILDRLWDDLSGRPMTSLELDKLIKSSVSLIPDEDPQTWIPEQGPAEDAAAAVSYALEARRTRSSQEAAWSARRAYEAVDEYIVDHHNIDTNLPGEELVVLSDPLMQAELARQKRDLDELTEAKVTVQALRARAAAEAIVFPR
jgi:uncharacterized protein YjaG (DUF416 family)